MLQYARPTFKKRHELDVLRRIHKEPRWLKQKAKVESTAWKNYFYGKHETNDILNEVRRMEGIIGDMVRPVRGDYLENANKRWRRNIGHVTCLPQCVCNNTSNY